jgi:hypothetical protein
MLHKNIHIQIGDATTAFADPDFVAALHRYSNQIHPDTLFEKCGDAASYVNGFRACILDEVVNTRVRDKLQMIHSILPSSPLLTRSPNYILVSDRLEYGMPFTLANWVILPKSILDKQTIDDLANTMSHEQMHILQWKYPMLHQKCTRDILHYRQVKIHGRLPIIPFVNPDGEQTASHSWVFEIDGSTYCPYLIMDKPYSLKKVGVHLRRRNASSYEVIPKVTDLSILLRDRFTSCPMSHRYHPYEILAELGAQYIQKGTTEIPELDKFYRDLSITCSTT